MKIKLDLILFAAALITVGLLAHAWRSARHDSQQLAATLAAQNTIVQQAGDREQQRDKQLQTALAAIQAQKRAVRTPRQAAQQLASVLPPLPLPVLVSDPTLSSDPIASIDPSSSANSNPSVDSNFVNPNSSVDTDPSAQSNLSPDLNLPAHRAMPGSSPSSSTTISVPQADLLPLYNGLQDCRSNVLQNESLQKDLSDEKLRSAALLRERDIAVAAAQGGTFHLRLKRAVKWFAIGAATAALASTRR